MKYIISCFILAAILIPLAFCGKKQADPGAVGTILPGGLVVTKRQYMVDLYKCVTEMKSDQAAKNIERIEVISDEMPRAALLHTKEGKQILQVCADLGGGKIYYSVAEK